MIIGEKIKNKGIHDKQGEKTGMKETIILNRIDKLIDSIDYKNAYVEIQTDDKKYMLEKDRKNKIGFEIHQEIK